MNKVRCVSGVKFPHKWHCDICGSPPGRSCQKGIQVAFSRDAIVPSVEGMENLQKNVDYWGDRCCKAEAELAAARGALAMIHNSTEPDAWKHRDYDHLASNIYGVAKAALDGEFVDDMHCAEVYDKLYPRAPRS